MLEKNVARNTLLETKFDAPLSPARWIVREGLVERLLEGIRSRLVLVCAPAGFGKTTLVRQWIAANSEQVAFRPIAWVSLDAGDNDPARFWVSVIAALRTCLPEIGTHALALLHTATPLASSLTTLLNELAGQHAEDSPLVLILDDYHVIDEPSIHASLAFSSSGPMPSSRETRKRRKRQGKRACRQQAAWSAISPSSLRNGVPISRMTW